MKSPNVVMMAIPDAIFSAALQTWLSCAVADRTDHDNAICQAMHKATVIGFHDMLTR